MLQVDAPGVRPGSLAFEPVHGGALEFPVGVALFDIFPFIELDLTLAHTEQDFYFALLPIKRQRDKRVSLYGCELEEFADLRFVKQELSDRFGWMVLAVALRIFVDVRVVKEGFVS